MSQIFFLAAILKQYFFFIFFFKNVIFFMFSYFEPKFIEKFHRKMGFWNGTIFECSFYWFIVVLGVYRYGASFVPEFLREST